MEDVAIPEPKVIASGGFRIEIRPGELTVTHDRRAWKPVNRSALIRVLRIILFAVLACSVLIQVVSGINGGDLGGLAVVAVIFLIALTFAMRRGDNNIHCTRDCLEVMTVLKGKLKRKRSFPTQAVKKIRFGAVSISQYSATCGLIFEAEGKKTKTLAGLESPEAQIILKELDSLGFDIEHDVGMPMMVEMALERRNSWLGH